MKDAKHHILILSDGQCDVWAHGADSKGGNWAARNDIDPISNHSSLLIVSVAHQLDFTQM